MFFWPYTEGKREQIQKLRAKRTKKIGFWTVYKGKTWKNPEIAREAREKNLNFLAVYRGETLKTMKKRPPKAAENFYKNKTPHIQIGWDFEKWNPRT